MFKVESNYWYTKNNEWAYINSNEVVTCGIDDMSQSNSGKIVFVDLPEISKQINAGEPICYLESVKSIADVHSPLTGIVIEVNLKLLERPEIINESCYKEGWLFKLKISKDESLEKLLSAEDYKKMIS